MAGFIVDRGMLDQTAAEAVVNTREAFRKVETVYDFLANNPLTEDGDPLTKPAEEGGYFGYTDEEASLIRTVIETLHSLEPTDILHIGKKLTGLQ